MALNSFVDILFQIAGTIRRVHKCLGLTKKGNDILGSLETGLMISFVGTLFMLFLCIL
jgi:hypothetical protein